MIRQIKLESAVLACAHTRLLQNEHGRLIFENKNKKIDSDF